MENRFHLHSIIIACAILVSAYLKPLSECSKSFLYIIEGFVALSVCSSGGDLTAFVRESSITTVDKSAHRFCVNTKYGFRVFRSNVANELSFGRRTHLFI